ncbi:uncharacterized protein SCHCODRAFT_02626903 [Schizophyllum commune H4-8]|nr:uncharacterized protein SCHCODRAFT_02626903 [Schizophyllum commune H4-8]KAI5892706.1 hypothetical protein SCHCODRAFT_02626903 [Schizophyllum commune H4-8]
MGNRVFVAGGSLRGQMEVECRADKGLALNVMMVELFAIQELTSRDHSATSTFIHARRLFQGPGLPPSNAVQALPAPGDPQYPNHYYQARRGISTFPFRIPVPSTSPSSITFGSGLAKVRYEVRATVGVFWKGEKRLVIDKTEVDVVESYEEDFARAEPEGVVVGENGKIWAQGRVIGGVVVAGESACVELQLKNHSTKKNSGLAISLSRHLVLPEISGSGKPPLQIADTLTSVSFKSADYIMPPGAEGVASLVFDVPKHARGVRGGPYEGGGQLKRRESQAIFEIKTILEIKILMGLTGKDIVLEIPVPVVHPLALPEMPAQDMMPPLSQATPYPMFASPPPPKPYFDPGAQVPWPDYRATSPYASPTPYNPIGSPVAYYDQAQQQVWLPPPSVTPQPYQYFSPPNAAPTPYWAPQAYPNDPQPSPPPPPVPPRPSSAGATRRTPDGLPPNVTGQHTLLPLVAQAPPLAAAQSREEGKGERASRIAQTLHHSSRHRSVSPQAHRYPVPAAPPHQPIPPHALPPHALPPPLQTSLSQPPAGLASPQSPGEAILHSPRPMLTPKHSFTSDPNMRPKSENVTDLESMADEINEKVNDLSGDLPKGTFSPPPVDPSARYRKPTLAALGARVRMSDVGARAGSSNSGALAPPVPAKDKRQSLPAVSRRTTEDTAIPTAATASDAQEPPSPQKPRTPPTPNLTAVRPVAKRQKSATYLASPTSGPSGLDALEAKLLAQVGTRKADEGKRVPDVRSVLSETASPIEIPKKASEDEMMDESAISSLTLANELAGDERPPLQDLARVEQDLARQEQDLLTHEQLNPEWEEKTHQGARSNGPQSDGEDLKDKRKGRSSHGERGEKKKDRSHQKKDKKSGTKEKKSVTNGRVAAWLGGVVDADRPSPPPTVVTPSPATPLFPLPDQPERSAIDSPEVSEMAKDASPTVERPISHVEDPAGEAEQLEQQQELPNPRSSGFVAIGTYKREEVTYRRVSRFRTAEPEARKLTDIWGSEDGPSAGERRETSSGTAREISTSTPRPDGDKTPRITAAQPPSYLPPVPRLDPEVKYDIRSARGGRGGRVTAVAALWASGAVQGAQSSVVRVTKPAIAKPPVEVKRAARPPVLVKPPSLAGQAAVTSSHAAPHLSSTASLARPALTTPQPRVPAARISPIVEETSTSRANEDTSPPVATSPSKPAFSKTRESLTNLSTPKPAPRQSLASEGFAFGQARLRELIKKYQGSSSSSSSS